MAPRKKITKTGRKEIDFIENDGLTTAQRLAVYQRDGGRCQLCGNSVAFAEMIAGFADPAKTVEASDLSKRVTLHFRCQVQQGGEPIDDVRKRRREKIHNALKERLADIPLGMSEIIKNWEKEK
ncbi:MAG: hypothetical protein Kow0090_17480 [Myxococcota bacterium]